jgi:hypothetical protein
MFDADAVLSSPLPSEALQPIAWRYSQVLQGFRSIQEQQLSVGSTLYVRRQPARSLASKHLLRFGSAEASNHTTILTSLVNIVKR